MKLKQKIEVYKTIENTLVITGMLTLFTSGILNDILPIIGRLISFLF